MSRDDVSDVPSAARLRRGELARLTGVGAETIRWYEREGLLQAPERSEGNHRFYDQSHVANLQAISRLRELGFEYLLIKDLLRASRSELEHDQALAIVQESLTLLKKKSKALQKLRSAVADQAQADVVEIARSFLT